MSKNTIEIDAPITLDHTSFVDYAFNHWLDCLKLGIKPKILCLLGPPGIGKSSTAYAIADRMSSYVRENPSIIFGKGVNTTKDVLELIAKERGLDLSALSKIERAEVEKECFEAFALLLDFSSLMPEDLGGLPFRNGEFTDYCPQRWVGKLCKKYAFGVYVQDDLPAAPQAMQVAGRQSALERRIHEHRFQDGVLVIVTGNRRQDKSSASTLPAHFRNSVTMMTIELALSEWKKWYGRQIGCDPVVPAFLTFKPDLLSELPTDTTDKLGAFATPRQWHSLGQQFVTAERLGAHFLTAIAAGLIGKANALTFLAFVEIRSNLTDPELVLDNPQSAMPDPLKELDDPSKRCAMATALGTHAAARWVKLTGTARDNAPTQLFAALAHCAVAGDEYCAVGVQTFLDEGGDLTALSRVARKAKTDPVIGRLLDHVKRAILGV